MPGNPTVASMLVTMRHEVERLGERAGADETGAELLHDCRNQLVLLEDAEKKTPSRAKLLELTNRSTAIHERVRDYILGRETLERTLRSPDDPILSPYEIARVEEAHAGPTTETMAKCPACKGCLLCADRRLVSVRDAVDWRARNAPKE